LEPERELVVILHEGIHAGVWDLSEETVTELAEDLGALVWQCGYRRDEE